MQRLVFFIIIFCIQSVHNKTNFLQFFLFLHCCNTAQHQGLESCCDSGGPYNELVISWCQSPIIRVLSNCSHVMIIRCVCDMWCSSPSEQAQSPEDIPPIDPRVVYDLEQHARRVADNLDTMMQGLTNKLYKVCHIQCDPKNTLQHTTASLQCVELSFCITLELWWCSIKTSQHCINTCKTLSDHAEKHRDGVFWIVVYYNIESGQN